MDEQVFVDGIGTISVIGGTVRLDFVTYSPIEKDVSGQPAATFHQRIIMGAETFLHSADKIHEAAQTLRARSASSEPVSFTPPAPAPTVQATVSSLPSNTRSLQEPRTEVPPKAVTKPPFP